MEPKINYIEALNQKLIKALSEQVALKKKNNDLISNAAKLTADINMLRKDNDSLKSGNHELKADIQTLKSEVTELKELQKEA